MSLKLYRQEATTLLMTVAKYRSERKVKSQIQVEESFSWSEILPKDVFKMTAEMIPVIPARSSFHLSNIASVLLGWTTTTWISSTHLVQMMGSKYLKGLITYKWGQIFNNGQLLFRHQNKNLDFLKSLLHHIFTQKKIIWQQSSLDPSSEKVSLKRTYLLLVSKPKVK